jgi:hypothetical protein
MQRFEHDRYVRSISTILGWEQTPEAAILWANKALTILQVQFFFIVVDESKDIVSLDGAAVWVQLLAAVGGFSLQ